MKFIVESCRTALARYNCHGKVTLQHHQILLLPSPANPPTSAKISKSTTSERLPKIGRMSATRLSTTPTLSFSTRSTLTLIYSTRSYSTLSCSYSKLLLLSATLALSSSFSQQLFLSATLTLSYSYSQQLYCQLLLLSATLLSAALLILVWHSQKAKPSSNTIWYIWSTDEPTWAKMRTFCSSEHCRHIHAFQQASKQNRKYFQGVIFRTTNANLCQAACRSAAQMAWTSSQIEMKSKTRLYLSIF